MWFWVMYKAKEEGPVVLVRQSFGLDWNRETCAWKSLLENRHWKNNGYTRGPCWN